MANDKIKDELDDDLKDELNKEDSWEKRMEILLLAILKTLKKKNDSV